MISNKPLRFLKKDDKFIHNGKTYTVFQSEGNMVEVFDGKDFSVWPIYNGKQDVIVNYLSRPV